MPTPETEIPPLDLPRRLHAGQNQQGPSTQTRCDECSSSFPCKEILAQHAALVHGVIDADYIEQQYDLLRDTSAHTFNTINSATKSYKHAMKALDEAAKAVHRARRASAKAIKRNQAGEDACGHALRQAHTFRLIWGDAAPEGSEEFCETLEASMVHERIEAVQQLMGVKNEVLRFGPVDSDGSLEAYGPADSRVDMDSLRRRRRRAQARKARRQAQAT